MTTGLTHHNSDHSINDARKTAVINNELSRLGIDIAALQETRLSDAGIIHEQDYTFFWQGKPADATREHGVGFAVSKRLKSMVEVQGNGTERLLSLNLHTSSGCVSLISAYSPTLMAPAETKDSFYAQLSSTISSIPNANRIVLLGDFNARVGADNTAWPSALGCFGTGRLNENGQRLLELCNLHNLCITNTFFSTKPQHKVSWRHPRSKHWHLIDYIVVRRHSLNDVTLTRSYHSADCDTDHVLVCSNLKLTPKKLHQSKRPGKPRLDVTRMQEPALVQQFAAAFNQIDTTNAETATQTWEKLQESIHQTAKVTFGTRTKRSEDWFESNAHILLPLIEAKRKAHLAHQDSPTRANLNALKSARKKVQQAVRHCANDYWSKLSQEIQTAADTGNIRGMYEGIKRAFGPTPMKTAPLKSLSGETITSKEQQLERWVEHYSELYSRENMITDEALNSIGQLPVMTELDSEPTIDELTKAIERLPLRKAPGSDGIPPDLIKHCKGPLLQPLYELLLQCWRENSVPQDMRDAKIITLYKNKGERSDCNNYRGISLLCIVGKVFARVILTRLQTLAENIYPESQCGFRSNRSTIDMIFSLKILQEKCREQQRPLYIAFIDLTKAFDLVSRDGLFKLLPKIGCPPKLTLLAESFHSNMKGTIQYDGSMSSSFEIKSGVKQGCVLAPTLFGIFFSLLLRHAFGTAQEGIYLRSRSDGRLFNLSRLRAKTLTRKVMLRDMLFADDAAITAHSEADLQALIKRFSEACRKFKLTISLKKTKIMGQNTAATPSISIGDYTLENVDHFTYLGSTITNNISLEKEMDLRIGRASATLAKLKDKVWTNGKLTIKTKMGVYSACVISTLLYGSETWTTYTRHEKRLNSFHLRSLRSILGISWQDKVTNNEILSHSGLPSMTTLLRQRRLRWLGHVRRMDDGRIPKDVLYGELETGKRPTGRPLLRYTDVVKRDLKALHINCDTWEKLADDRRAWKSTTTQQLKVSEQELREEAERKRHERKARSRDPNAMPNSIHRCTLCNRDCHSRIGLHSHLRRCSRQTAP
jgi:exonuclease III